MRYFLFLLIVFTCLSGRADDFLNTKWSEKYSYKDFSDTTFENETDLNGLFIRGSMFYREGKPNSHVFPENMTGVAFVECNLDNVFIPPGNKLYYCTNKNIKAQPDGEDYVLDKDLKPLKKVMDLTLDDKDLDVRKNEK